MISLLSEAMVRPIVARDLMTPEVLSLGSDLTLAEAAAFLAENDITGAVVKDAAGEMVGVITVSDLLEALTEGEAGQPVHEAMTPEIYSVPADAPVAEIARTLLDNDLHRLFVSDGERLIGTISSSDLLGLLIEEG